MNKHANGLKIRLEKYNHKRGSLRRTVHRIRRMERTEHFRIQRGVFHGFPKLTIARQLKRELDSAVTASEWFRTEVNDFANAILHGTVIHGAPLDMGVSNAQ